MERWCLAELPHPSKPLPLPLLFMYGDTYFALIEWGESLLQSKVVGPLQRNTVVRNTGAMPILEMSKCIRIRHALRTIFATASGEWVHGRHVLPNSNLSFFSDPLPSSLHPTTCDTDVLQRVLNNMNLPEERNIIDPQRSITRDTAFTICCRDRRSIVFAIRDLVRKDAEQVVYSVNPRVAVACGGIADGPDMPEVQLLNPVRKCKSLSMLPVLVKEIEYDSGHNCVRGLFCIPDVPGELDCWMSAKKYRAKALKLGATVENCPTFTLMTNILFGSDSAMQSLLEETRVVAKRQQQKKQKRAKTSEDHQEDVSHDV